MATKLIKPVKREMLASCIQHGKNRNKAIIVELLPGDEISFRVKGTRAQYIIYLGHCFRLAQIQTVEKNYREAVEKYKNRGQRRMRKPKRNPLPFNSIYYKAIK